MRNVAVEDNERKWKDVKLLARSDQETLGGVQGGPERMQQL